MIQATLGKLVMVVVGLVLLIIIVVKVIPQQAEQYVPDIVSYVVPVNPLAQPCNFYCYAQQTDWERYLMMGNYSNGDYTSVLSLPDFFSCNFQLLNLVTHALELAKWNEVKPLLFFYGLSGDSKLLIKSDDFLSIPRSLSSLFNSGVLDSFPKTYSGCVVKYVGSSLRLICPQHDFVLPEVDFKVNNSCLDKTTTGSAFDNPKPNPYADYCAPQDVVPLTYDAAHGVNSVYTCNVDDEYLLFKNLLKISESHNNGFSFCSKNNYDINVSVNCDQYFKTSFSESSYCYVMNYHYDGGEVINCDNSITVDDDYNINIDYGPCTAVIDGVVENIGDCNDLICGDDSYMFCDVPFFNDECESVDGGKKCSISESGDEYYLVTGSNSGDITIRFHNASVDEPCVPLYNEGGCVMFCNDSDSISFSGDFYDVSSGGFSISPLSNDYLYGDVFNFKIFAIIVHKYVKEHRYTEDEVSYSYDVFAGVTETVLMPRNKKVELQQGLRNFKVTLNPLAPTHTFGAEIPVKKDPWLIAGATTFPRYFENATKMLYDCASGGYCDDHAKLDYRHFCFKDDYLKDYPFVDCLDSTSLAQKFNGSNFIFEFREGSDLYNDFSCDGNFNACNVELYSDDDCRPAWKTYIEHKGRCEDLALMYYTVFRTLGLPHGTDDSGELGVSLNISYCDLPCPCRKLIESANCHGLGYTQTNCVTHQYVTVAMDLGDESVDCGVDLLPDKPGCTFDACPVNIKGVFDYLNASTYVFSVNNENFHLVQNFTAGGSDYYPVYLDYNFNTGLKTFNTPHGVVLDDYCNGYDVSNINVLISECSNFVKPSERNDFINSLNSACGGSV